MVLEGACDMIGCRLALNVSPSGEFIEKIASECKPVSRRKPAA